MPRNDEGEFELVLGNRQLLSVFLVVAALLGVCFAMGVVVGRSTQGISGLETAKVKKAPEGPPSTIVVEPPVPASPAALKQPESGGAAQPPVREPAALPASKPDTESRQTAAKPVVEPAPAPVEAGSEPGQGQTFLQVAAVKRPEAELLVDVLRKKGFAAQVAPGPSAAIFRVLVGPLKDPQSVVQARSGLESAGFKPIIRKY